MYDLRSDTVTKPSKKVLESALNAELGDDEYIEDPTVNNLEDECANLLGFEKGLFVTSGLMGNQISLLIHNDPGTEVITPHDSHIKNYEHGAAAFLSRVQFRDAEHTDGELNLDYVEKLILKSKVHKPIIKTVSIENTHLASGGSIVSFDSIKSLSKIVREHSLKLHVDGARIWHAIQEDKNNMNYGYHSNPRNSYYFYSLLLHAIFSHHLHGASGHVPSQSCLKILLNQKVQSNLQMPDECFQSKQF